jgi:hypothetical protein
MRKVSVPHFTCHRVGSYREIGGMRGRVAEYRRIEDRCEHCLSRHHAAEIVADSIDHKRCDDEFELGPRGPAQDVKVLQRDIRSGYPVTTVHDEVYRLADNV